jgi:pimeloyl-ACP methyl ester carboxylesterase
MRVRIHALLSLALLSLAPGLLPATAAAGAEGFSEKGGAKIHYWVEGKEGGAPVLLVHGFAGNAEFFRMAPLLAALKDDFAVIGVDVRGHGKSDKPHDPESYGMHMVDDLVGLLDHLAIEKASVVGYSMGGALALALVARHPGRVTCAVVGGYGYRPAPEDPDEDVFEQVATALEKGEGFGPLHTVLTAEGDEPMPEAQQKFISQMLLSTNDAQALAAVARSLDALVPGAEALRANEVPTFAIVGARDGLRPDVERLASIMGDLRVCVVPGADHMETFVQPQFTEEVKAFLREHARAAKAETAGAATDG